jgi:hypothetical protein
VSEAAMVEAHVSNIFAKLGPRPDCHPDLDRRVATARIVQSSDGV